MAAATEQRYYVNRTQELLTIPKAVITIWDRKTLRLIDVISLSSLSSLFSKLWSVRLSYQVDTSLLALACMHPNASTVTVWDMGGRTVGLTPRPVFDGRTGAIARHG